ncbi:MAG: hypothetical protein NTY48_00925 [Candidatus Diapherotrites archaeon]|nr:hypothetical protein [Candidatus Diapherotrites archaeon]
MKKLRMVVLIIILIVIIIAFFGYFFVLSPSFVAKANISKTPLISSAEIDNSHINWILNEVGAYKLHSNMYFSGEPAVIESVITDQNKVFTTTINNNVPSTISGPAVNPDLRFTMTAINFARLYATSDILSNAQKMRKSGEINIEILKEVSALATKGYKSIYDSLPS